ncbi:MAG: ribonuclease III [Dehalococcoidia bacterium]
MLALTTLSLSDLERLQRGLGVRFRDPQLLREALVHSSFVHEVPSPTLAANERLEFLGDAALGLIIAQKLYKDYPHLREGQLTTLRAALVRTPTLAEVGRRLGLGDYLMLGRGEEASGGRRRPTNLARAFEAIVGAVLVDGGLAKARALVLRCLRSELAAAATGPLAPDYKSRLQQLAQSRWHQAPTYRLLEAAGPDHARTFEVAVEVGGEALGTGRGPSKKAAEQQAAGHALRTLGEDDPER